MARFFIDRPIFAWVIAIIIMLSGLLAIKSLPIAQYPKIAPITVDILTAFPGASAETVQDTVTQVIEQQMNGIDNLRYLYSTSDSTGKVDITLTFEAGTNPDIAQVQVQNKLQTALRLLPQEVQQQGVSVAKTAKNYVMIVALISDNPHTTRNDLTDYMASNMQDIISRIDGVGDVQLFGTQYAMRIWLNPHKLYQYNLTVQDVQSAILSQNAQIAAGQLGGTPTVDGQQLNAPIIAQTRLKSPEEFGNILLRVNKNGSQVKLHDVARVELGGENYDNLSYLNDKPAGALAIRLSATANALETTKAVRKKVDELAEFFPTGMKVEYPFDTTPFIKVSIKEVIKTLLEAVVLVFLVILVFLQNIRATLIPTIAIPVVLLGTFAVLAVFGYSINTLTLFGIVLAIGLLVDDAIVVVENVERIMREEKLSPRDATIKSMDQITGALVGIGLVLSAVFVPMGFFGSSTGIIYRQFSITIVSAMILSVLVALILTPALCATLLKSDHDQGTDNKAKGGYNPWYGAQRAIDGFFKQFNYYFNKGSQSYQNSVKKILGQKGRYFLIYGAVMLIMIVMFKNLPTAFLPEEDQGYMFTQAILPPGATMDRTMKSLNEAKEYFLNKEKEAVDSVLLVGGVNFAGRGQNTGLMFIKMKDWEERQGAHLTVQAVAKRAGAAFSRITDGLVIPFVPPAVLELGNATGFDFILQDRASLGHDGLMAARNQMLGMAAQNSVLTRVRPNGLDDITYYGLKVDQEKAKALSLSIADINNILSVAWGSAYINDFLDQGRVKKVFLQGDAPFRMLPQHLNDWYVRNAMGKLVSFASFSRGEWRYGSPRLERFNGLPAVEIVGEPSTGHSTGDAMKVLLTLAEKLPPGIGLDWINISYEERLAGAQAPILFAISLIVVFLALAALYESWSIPLSVLMVVPLGIVGALIATLGRGLSNDVYFQVGLLTTIGLSTKNAILIVEFAKELYSQGRDLVEATLEAVRLRLRPIIMTSLAFTLGVLPLALAHGAGSGSQVAIGTGVLGGVLTATFLGIFFIPLFFVVVYSFFHKQVPQYPYSSEQLEHKL